MKTLTSANARTPQDAVALAQQAHRDGQTASMCGGGSDLLGLVKERILTPDVVVNLKTMIGEDQIEPVGPGLRIGGQVTLAALSDNALVRRRFTVLAEAAEGVGTPQIRNAGTLAGNLCQRPWCWYFRNGFPCYKAGGNRCFSFAGENQFHAIFGGGPSYIVHPSDTAPALVALDAVFHIAGPSGRREMPASDFFVLPARDPTRENALGDEDLLVAVEVPAPPAAPVVRRSGYHKVMDRESWTHAIISAAVVLEMDDAVCRAARIVLGGVAPVPWRVPEAERVLVGRRVSPALAARAAEVAVAGATPLSKNGYKVALTAAVIERAIERLGTGP